MFGSRFIKGGGVIDYPKIKLPLNRLANLFLKIPFRHQTQRHHQRLQGLPQEVIEGCRPLITRPHFNLTVEMPLKAIVRGFSWTTLPYLAQSAYWHAPKLNIKEMGKPLPFSFALFVWLGRAYFSKGEP